MLEAWIDGACEPINPGGTASYGLVVKLNNDTIHQEAKVVGSGREMSNNVAEYSGLIALIDWYSSLQLQSDIKVYSDSQLVINQMTGEWNVNKGLYVPYYWKTIQRLKALYNYHGGGKFLYQWIPREENWEADKLSKQVLIANGIKVRGK